MKQGYSANIERITSKNTHFRQVVYTATHCQLVLMSLLPGEEIGLETHVYGDQFFRFESGEGQVTINDNVYLVGDGDCIIVPQGCAHNVVNTSTTQSLKLYTLYSPPHHKDQIARATKSEATKHEAEFDGKTTE
jgi:mannose-6-phosphate isomerase-like protein (cupin superfamily)